ncbi:protein FAR1-RELATED SEQUENCE 5-like [Camellia sinensis]|uniref:protein FAR1-RELATED SEQUENCE 5-like n=1 Tax=Camellia sinensis TaxID=4442 RepID=UPI001036A1BA|nr:protein FAR1-RELATED SEQUENCE 5-like [Camellia sinensis]
MEDSALEKLANNSMPCVGMEFDSEEGAYEFYNEYGRIVGFSIRRDYHTKSKKDGIMINRKFVCCKKGEKEKDKRYITVKHPQHETRTKCNAFMYISFRRDLSKWVLMKFDDNHNYLLHIPQCTHMMPSQRKLCDAQGINVDVANDIGISLKASHDLISALARGKEFVGFTREDQKTYLRAKRQRNLQYGEAGSLLRYFQQQAIENPYFYFAFQLDVDEMITNIFWADHQIITDFGISGDVVSFDTTSRTNKEYRPLALFTGFNHFRMTVIFGAALLYDETTTSFEWLFETFLHAMSGKKHVSFFTDQDQAMAKAISKIMPEVFHGLCTFHLMQNALKHLGYLFKGGLKFGCDFKTCIFGYENEHELVEAWDSLIHKYNLQENLWIKKTWELREKWAHVYMKLVYTARMRSTQLSESLNAELKRHLKVDHNIVQFFTHFNRVVMDKRSEEVKAIYNSRQRLPRIKLKMSPMLIQVAKLYTPPIFDLFHNELDISLCCQVKRCHALGREVTYVIGLYGEDREYIVKCNVEVNKSGGDNICPEIHCTCQKFESFGILYGHAIKALDRMNIMKIPERYILGRWRLDARDCAIEETVTVVENDPKLVIAARYRDLCPRMVKLAARSSEYKPAYQLVDETLKDLCAKVDNTMTSLDSSGTSGSDGNIEVGTKEFVIDPNLQVKMHKFGYITSVET